MKDKYIAEGHLFVIYAREGVSLNIQGRKVKPFTSKMERVTKLESGWRNKSAQQIRVKPIRTKSNLFLHRFWNQSHISEIQICSWCHWQNLNLIGVWLYNWHSSVRQYWLDAERSHQFKSSSETHFLAQNRIGQKSPGEDFNTTAWLSNATKIDKIMGKSLGEG